MVETLHSGIIVSPGEKVYVTEGSGDGLCLVLSNNIGKGVGLGDHIQSLPVIYELVKSQKVTVYANESYRELYERAGCIFFSHTRIDFNFEQRNKERFAKIYTMLEWGIDNDNSTKGRSIINRTSLFASFFELERPDAFDFKEALGAQRDTVKAIVFSPQSNAHFKQRQLPRERQIYHLLKDKFPEKSILWLGTPQIDQRWEIKSLVALISIVYNAEYVLATDNGIMNLAMALETPTMAVFGATNEFVVCEPYKFYTNGIKAFYRATTIRDCDCPCSFQSANGYGVAGRCSEQPDCMLDVVPSELVESFYQFTRSN